MAGRRPRRACVIRKRSISGVIDDMHRMHRAGSGFGAGFPTPDSLKISSLLLRNRRRPSSVLADDDLAVILYIAEREPARCTARSGSPNDKTGNTKPMKHLPIFFCPLPLAPV